MSAKSAVAAVLPSIRRPGGDGLATNHRFPVGSGSLRIQECRSCPALLNRDDEGNDSAFVFRQNFTVIHGGFMHFMGAAWIKDTAGKPSVVGFSPHTCHILSVVCVCFL